jgi:hypothetical protein
MGPLYRFEKGRQSSPGNMGSHLNHIFIHISRPICSGPFILFGYLSIRSSIFSSLPEIGDFGCGSDFFHVFYYVMLYSVHEENEILIKIRPAKKRQNEPSTSPQGRPRQGQQKEAYSVQTGSIQKGALFGWPKYARTSQIDTCKPKYRPYGRPHDGPEQSFSHAHQQISLACP